MKNIGISLKYIQTNPPAGSKLVYGPIHLEITGWTEPGTEIFIDSEEVSVPMNGGFRKTISLTPSRNVITFNATDGDSKKEIIREYEIIYP